LRRLAQLAALFSCTGVTQAQIGLPSGSPISRPITLFQTKYRLRAGDRVAVAVPQETLEFVRGAKSRVVSVNGGTRKGLAIGPNRDGDQIMLAASLTAPPGEYSVNIAALSDAGEQRTATVDVVVEPPQAVPSSSSSPPVVLVNGFQFSLTGGCSISSTTPPSMDTFGNLQTTLMNAGLTVYFFDNCVESPNQGPIESLGNDFAQFVDMLQSGGAPVPQVDVVVHSMGGLIVRSYLAGLQTDGTLVPPANPKIRKFIEIATPNFGSFIASLGSGSQPAEMTPGSSFLWSLATWNQGGDDLRGVDALAVIGNLGYAPSSGFPPANGSDGVLTLTSGSLGFTRDLSRVRILPYCHTDFSEIDQIVVDCLGSSIAKAPETASIVSSFLANTTAWQSVGTAPAQDPLLSKYGGIYFTSETNTRQPVNLSNVTFGTATLNNGGASGVVFYNDFIQGTNTFSENKGQLSCGPFTEPAGHFTTLRCKSGPQISSVGPLLASQPGWVVESGAPITIHGAGFGHTQCATCTVSIDSGTALKVSSWSDQAITALLPLSANTAVTKLSVQNAAGSDYITFLSAPAPAITGTVSSASGTITTLAPASIATAYGSNFSVGTNATTVTVTDSAGSQQTATLFYVSAGQINFLVPSGTALGTAQVTVMNGAGLEASINVQIANVAPGIFELNTSALAAAIAVIHAPDGTKKFQNVYQHGASNAIIPLPIDLSTGPVTLELYGTGIRNAKKVTAMVGNQSVPVTFAGAQPTFMGLDQVNIGPIPQSLAGSGPTNIVLTADGHTANTVNVTFK
jgi:uncharacterized protein (TIGR03437 family)